MPSWHRRGHRSLTPGKWLPVVASSVTAPVSFEAVGSNRPSSAALHEVAPDRERDTCRYRDSSLYFSWNTSPLSPTMSVEDAPNRSAGDARGHATEPTSRAVESHREPSVTRGCRRSKKNARRPRYGVSRWERETRRTGGSLRMVHPCRLLAFSSCVRALHSRTPHA